MQTVQTLQEESDQGLHCLLLIQRSADSKMDMSKPFDKYCKELKYTNI